MLIVRPHIFELTILIKQARPFHIYLGYFNQQTIIWCLHICYVLISYH